MSPTSVLVMGVLLACFYTFKLSATSFQFSLSNLEEYTELQQDSQQHSPKTCITPLSPAASTKFCCSRNTSAGIESFMVYLKGRVA